MPRPERKALIEQLQAARGGRLLICYVTSTRSGHEIHMADDMLRFLFEHLEEGKENSAKGIDLFIHSNGGSATVPWRLVSLIREYTKNFVVMVPHRAFSAATLVALGADQILMHKMGCLGPIDPSVQNVFNPPHPLQPGSLAHISVEDVSAYFKMVREEVGIRHEDELIQALESLTSKVHPLALGNVQRSHSQSKMMARKLLKSHVSTEKEHEIEQLIENLKSNLFFHGHPINRDEATRDLKLKVEKPSVDVEKLMWDLYLDYETDLEMTEPFSVAHEIEKRSQPASTAVSPPLTVQQIVQTISQMAQNGIGLPGLSPQQVVEFAAAMAPHVSRTPVQSTAVPSKVSVKALRGAYLESATRSDVFLTDMTIERSVQGTPMGPQEVQKTEVLWQRWTKV